MTYVFCYENGRPNNTISSFFEKILGINSVRAFNRQPATFFFRANASLAAKMGTGSAVTVKHMKVYPDIPLNMCAKQLGGLLNCFAASGDIHATGECASAAEFLQMCMRTAPIPAKRRAPTINYHLGRLGKDLR
ncbi:hypothetical protein DL96DRAFT_1703261 [Flagelloscypha sp. PMI_526]|nr:hypothetical protein DL96DRAFT_1703261 [Flagelloscypha sp. PMI_526]